MPSPKFGLLIITTNTTDIHEHNEHKSRGIYLRDDHCDWGSSGMNEFTQEFSDKE